MHPKWVRLNPNRGSNSWPPDHNSTFHVTVTPALTTWPSVTTPLNGTISLEKCIKTTRIWPAPPYHDLAIWWSIYHPAGRVTSMCVCMLYCTQTAESSFWPIEAQSHSYMAGGVIVMFPLMFHRAGHSYYGIERNAQAAKCCSIYSKYNIVTAF